MRRRVLVVFGTRPEAIKLAPVVERLRERADDFETVVAVTAQHREMLDQVLGLFGIVPDHDLDIMRAGQTLTDLTTRSMSGLGPLMEELRPDVVVVQGDTTTTFAAALSAFYNGVPVAHVEAGLRSFDLSQPYPEELNRRLTSVIARWHFAPTETARARLLAERVEPESVYVTGNTVIDALLEVADTPHEFDPGPVADALASGRRIVLMTMHRRENWGEGVRQACEAARELVVRHPDIHLLFALHLNPDVQAIAREVLGGTDRVDLLGPLDYAAFVHLMRASTLILSDSGGVQEEAPSLGKPVLVLREVTERPEAVEAGTVRLVGVRGDRIVAEAARLLDDADAYATMARAVNPFGDGHAAERIAEVLAGEVAGDREAEGS
jgi:UDP-N-acetylglucosamine 2-epimerase (non-hydrolysing)